MAGLEKPGGVGGGFGWGPRARLIQSHSVKIEDVGGAVDGYSEQLIPLP
jgi:hypothetical protein